MKRFLLVIILFSSLLGLSSSSQAQETDPSTSEVSKNLHIAMIAYYSLLSKTNQDGDKSVAKGYTLGADANMMLFQVSKGWGIGPFASYTFTQAKNQSNMSEKWSMRNFQAGLRVIFSSFFFDAGYSTSTLFFTKDPLTIMGATQGFVVGAGYTLIDSKIIFRIVTKCAIETLQKNSQITYASSFNSLMLGAELGYTF